jgi:predicted acylesterase/phospholipase RssA
VLRLPLGAFVSCEPAWLPRSRLAPVPEPLTERAIIPGIPNARVWLDRDLTPFIEAVLRDTARERQALGSTPSSLPAAHALAISGGGDAGSFAAGILNGWTLSGRRPSFKVVTGISAGAVVAPFAFLGPQYDEVLHAVATTSCPQGIFRRRSVFLGLVSDGFASSEPLAGAVARYITSETLEEVAEEYAKGRVLQIGTTDIDSGRQVTWNMGEIASSGSPDALGLFRKVIVASASIPGAVSPVMIDVEVDGRRYQEMHVDGGVVSQVFLYPSSFFVEMRRAAADEHLNRQFHTYVIRNGWFQPSWNGTKRRTLDIGARAIRSLIQNQGINDVHRLYQIAIQDKVDFNLAYIGADFDAPHPQQFDTGYMRKLYEYGLNLATAGRQWHKSPPVEAQPSAGYASL